MTRSIYVAHPLSGDIHGNAERARRWLRWLLDHEPHVAFAVPWLPYVDVLDDANPAHRDRALRDCAAWATRCNGIVLVGGRRSPGMQIEIDACLDEGGEVYDLTALGPDPLAIDRTTIEQVVGYHEYYGVGPLAWGARQWEGKARQ